MEVAGALDRSSFSSYLEAIRELVRTRSRSFWIVAGLTALAAALRFATLGLQSYHHDEVVTASRILRGGFWHAMDAVGFSESAPPLYYAGAWAWTQVTRNRRVRPALLLGPGRRGHRPSRLPARPRPNNRADGPIVGD